MKTTAPGPVAVQHHFILHWFRHGDLRLRDNQALVHSCQTAVARRNNNNNKDGTTIQTYLIPFFCFDPKIFGSNVTTTGFNNSSLKCGPRRAQFIVQAVQDLKQQLTGHGSGLLVSHGQEPHEFVQTLIQNVSAAAACEANGGSGSCNTTTLQWTVVCQEEVLKEETDAVQAMKEENPTARVETVWGSTMYDRDDLRSFFGEDLQDLPNTFTPFRNKVEKSCEIGTPLTIPGKELKALFPSSSSSLTSSSFLQEALEPFLSSSSVPSLADLGYSEESIAEAATVDPRGVMAFVGGEQAALARTQDYIFTKDRLKIYFDTRNGMLGADYSTKLSPWLAHGCISPRTVAQECQRYERERGISNKSTYWVVFELLWRDYCKFFCAKHGNRIFYPHGILHKSSSPSSSVWKTDDKVLTAWKEGRTGYPLVDANMREMNATGFMSNRGRQNACSFLALDLQQDWRRGAAYFETHLLDYDVYSNWYNWCAGAGMTGGRVNRFNIVKQSKDYDQHGEYVRHWLPELKTVPTELVHEPWKLTQFQQREFGVVLGKDYPHRVKTAAPPPPPPQQGNNAGGGGGKKQRRQQGRQQQQPQEQQPPRNRNRNNRHQPYEMKSLKESTIRFKS